MSDKSEIRLAMDRREKFVSDIVEVCKKHRVLIECGEDEYDIPSFDEHPTKSGFGFSANIIDLEHDVRNAVWSNPDPGRKLVRVPRSWYKSRRGQNGK